jgi:hypothetical protein
MRNNFSFIQLSEVITGVISLPATAKEKKNPFIIVNSDDDRGLYIVKLEKEIAKYKNVKSETGETKFHEIQTNDLIVFGDSINFDYRTEMNYVTLISLAKAKDVKVYDLITDFNKITRRLATYCKNNGLKRKNAYRDDVEVRFNINVVEEPKRFVCPQVCPLAKRTLVNVYQQTPDVKVEQITVHHNWVKIGWNQYDIMVDLCGNELIVLEDGTKMFVKTDRFGRRYLTA